MDQIKNLNCNRPLGISGHLRVKNEPNTITLCVLTVLPALDELIITCQPYINIEKNRDETYFQCQYLKSLYPNKIKLFYYTPEVIAVTGSHISNQSEEIQLILQKYNNRIPENSIHSLSHYYNYGLVRISYKYYIKIDADHFYITQKLIDFRNALLSLDHKLGNKRNYLNKWIGKSLTPFYGPLSKWLSYKNFISFCYFFNKRCAFSLSGLNIGTKKYFNFTVSQQYKFQPLKMIKHLYIPLNPHKHNNFQILNGADHVIVPITSDNIYKLHSSGVEELSYINLKHILTLGIFSFHYGMQKRNIFITGKENIDYIALKSYLQTPVNKILNNAKFIGNFYFEKRHQRENLIYWKNKDDDYIKSFLSKIEKI